ncbi:MAG: hypothetical protein V7717_04610 [Porticoccaceae bacterium]
MILKLTDCFTENDDKCAVPGRVLGQVLDRVLGTVDPCSTELVAFYWDHRQWYLPQQPYIRLITLLYKTSAMAQPHLVVTDQLAAAESWLEVERTNSNVVGGAVPGGEALLKDFAEHCSVPVIALDTPVRLAPVIIPKPWGRELWYSGIEARGQSGIGSEDRNIPLPWLLALAGDALLGGDCQSINLLKILDPLPEPVYGDLYLELHEEKREVYVVTHVDKTAWPEGVGAIRYGFDTQVQAEYPDDASFRRAFCASTGAYEQVRREIDRAISSGLDSEALPLELQSREAALRQAMNRFTQLKPLVVGDVVKVPCLLPHSLQHGVRTVEFQTPVYERKILSFAQEVLTQQHWDTEAAVALMTTTPPVDSEFAVLENSPGLRRELIVEFDDFSVERVTLAPGAQWSMATEGRYALAMAVNSVLLAGRPLAAENAMLIPAGAGQVMVENLSDAPAIVLISRPGI